MGSSRGHEVGSRWGHLAPFRLPTPELTPLRIALAYSALGFLALYVSDVLLVRYYSDPLLSQIQAVKGSIEVLLTAGLIFGLTHRLDTQHRRDLDRLRQQHQELQVLHRVLRHNLRNDLNVIQGYAALIQDQSTTAEIHPACRKILNTVEKMMTYPDHASRIKEVNDSYTRTVAHDLTEGVPSLLETNPLVTDDIDISTSVPDRATVAVNPMFEEAVDEVLTNAIKHNDSETPTVRLEVDVDSGPARMVKLRVSDNGPGIPESEVNPLRAGKEDQLFHRLGLGLWFVEWTVRNSGGHLGFEENDLGGTTVVIHVPKAKPHLFNHRPGWLQGMFRFIGGWR